MANSGADEIVRVLKGAGVDLVFGIPSIHNIRLYETLRKEPAIRHILCRQETMAAHMADGYARAADRLGVVISSTGPGSGYMVPALHEAWGSASPVLMITTNIPTSMIGKGLGTLHEMENQDALFLPVTKATLLVRSAKEIPSITREAVRRATSGRPGPVYLEVPTDLFDSPVPVEGDGAAGVGEEEERGDLSGIEKAVSLIRHAKQPLLVVGAGALHPEAAVDIPTLAENLGAPVVTTVNAKGVIPEDHPLAFGSVMKKGVVRQLIQSCDVTVAIGSRLRDMDVRRRGVVFKGLIHLDWDDRWVERNFPAEAALIGDIPMILRELTQNLTSEGSVNGRLSWIGQMRKELQREMSEAQEAHQELRYLDAIRGALPREGMLVIDNTQLGYWAELFYPAYAPRGLMAPRGSGTIGFAFAAATGAKTGCPQRPVIGLIGDGGFLYGAQELATCMRHGIGFPLIVVNDGAYGIIGFLQQRAYQKAYESDLTNPDFVALAQAYGAKAARVDSPDGLRASLDEALASKEMWVIELFAPGVQPPFPMY